MEKPFVINFHEHHVDEAADMTVLMPVGKGHTLQVRKWAREKPDKIVAFHYIDVQNPIEDEMRQLKISVERWNVRGVKFLPPDQHIDPNDKRLYPVYEYCERMGLVTMFHAGIEDVGLYQLGAPILIKYCDPVHLDEVAFDFPDMKICIAHLGGNYMFTALVLAEKHENIYLDTAFLGYFGARFYPPATPAALIAHAVNILGADKVLYGGEGVTAQDVLDADISDEAKHKLLYQNAVRLLGLKNVPPQA